MGKLKFEFAQMNIQKKVRHKIDPPNFGQEAKKEKKHMIQLLFEKQYLVMMD